MCFVVVVCCLLLCDVVCWCARLCAGANVAVYVIGACVVFVLIVLRVLFSCVLFY